jgi:hypothetical protein
MGQRGRIRAPRPVLAVLAVLLLALGAAALASAHGSAAHGSGPLAGQWWLLAAAVIAAGSAAAVKLRRLIAYAEPASAAETRLQRGAFALIAVATAAVPFVLFFMHNHVSDSAGGACTSCPIVLTTGAQHAITQMPVKSSAAAPPQSIKLPLGLILLILVAVLAVLAAAVIAVLLLRWWGARGETEIDGAPLPASAEDEQDASALGMAVLAGRDALEGEARAAIIDCYAAMEASLADVGVPRLESDSPADLLARATERGVLGGPAPRLLAALFREARYSTHAMGTRHLDQARGALDEIAAQLAARAEAEAADRRAARAETAAGVGAGLGADGAGTATR